MPPWLIRRSSDRDEIQDIYRQWRSLLESYGNDKMAVVEAWVAPERASRYVAPDTLHQIFGFDFLVVAWDAKSIRRRHSSWGRCGIRGRCAANVGP